MKLREQIAAALNESGLLTLPELSGELQRRAGIKPMDKIDDDGLTNLGYEELRKRNNDISRKFRERHELLVSNGYTLLGLYLVLTRSAEFESVMMTEKKPKVGTLNVCRWRVRA